MIGTAAPLPPFSLVLDMLAPLTEAALDGILAEKPQVACFGRYWHTLEAAEVALIHSRGRSILPIQYAPSDELSSQLGTEIATRLSTKALALQCPATVASVIDFENEHGDAASFGVACATVWSRTGFQPGGYYGAPQSLTASQLYLLPVWPYWRGGSVGLQDPGCGPCLWQIPPLDKTVAGVRVDHSMSGLDARGRAFTVWAPG